MYRTRFASARLLENLITLPPALNPGAVKQLDSPESRACLAACAVHIFGDAFFFFETKNENVENAGKNHIMSDNWKLSGIISGE